MRDSQNRIRLLSFTLAIGVHAAVLFGSALVSQPPLAGASMGSFSVELVEGPPGGGEAAQEVSESPPIPDQTVPATASLDNEAELLPADQTASPNTSTNLSSTLSSRENLEPNLAATNLMASGGGSSQRAGNTAGDDAPGGLGGESGTGRGGVGGATWGDPRYGNNPPPIYPFEARRTGQQGTVVLSVRLNAHGTVETLAVKESSGHILLDQAAFRAIRRWHFNPATVAGIAVSSQVEIPVAFRLVE
jgi:protein TonB